MSKNCSTTNIEYNTPKYYNSLFVALVISDLCMHPLLCVMPDHVSHSIIAFVNIVCVQNLALSFQPFFKTKKPNSSDGMHSLEIKSVYQVIEQLAIQECESPEKKN